MTPGTLTDTHRPRRPSIGELVFNGDWACAHGDFGALRQVAHTLSVGIGEPLHCTLLDLADSCRCDPERAVTLWSQVKDHLYRTSDK
jgi:hypothetical protein